MKAATQPKPRLTRQDWIDAGIDLLSRVGVGSVTVEALASQLGVTRGSFYHHFGDRQDLLQAMLDFWAQRWTFDVRDQMAVLGLDPATTLLALARMIRSKRAANYDAPFRAWALHDPIARAVVERVDQVRLKTILAQFVALGFDGADAENRARLFLYYEVAAPAIFAEASPELDEQLLVERHRLLTTARVVD